MVSVALRDTAVNAWDRYQDYRTAKALLMIYAVAKLPPPGTVPPTTGAPAPAAPQTNGEKQKSFGGKALGVVGGISWCSFCRIRRLWHP